jgi:DNA repair photolyase
MIKEITAKTLLSHAKQPDPWFGIKYSMNLYRGCQHQCIYCDSRSECYRIENFNDILIKVNAIELLDRELSRKRVKGTIGTGAMNDPYMPVEADVKITQRALQVILKHKFPVHILTKSELVLRDLEILKQIKKVYAAVSFTVTTINDELGKKLEPGASLVSKRFDALYKLASEGITTGILLMPVLPFIEDTEENIKGIIKRASESGASYIIPAFGMTLRDRQREYYYNQLDRLFPGARQKYEIHYGEKYYCSVPCYKNLENIFHEDCMKYNIAERIKPFQETSSSDQLQLL